MKRNRIRDFIAGLIGLGLLLIASGVPVAAQGAQGVLGEPRVALVIGNSSYAKAPVANALNDAGLVAEALRSIGFEIVEGANLPQPDMMGAFRTFLAKVEAGGPQTVAFVYVSGHGLAFEGENFLVSVDARFEREGDIPLGAVRLADFMRPLAGTPAQARILVLDASRPLPFAVEGKPVRGLQPVDAPAGMLVAFASGPGTFAEDGAGPYGSYAAAIAEMIRTPGIDLETVFTRIRARAHQLTQGQQIPWHVSALGGGVVLVPGESARVSPALQADRPLREIGPDEGYALAITADNLDRYVEFVAAYPDHAYAPRVWSIIRARRDALTWLRTLERNSAEAYWTYLTRYPHGIFTDDARRRLRRIAAAASPPPGFAAIVFADVGLPLPGEPVEFATIHARAPPPPAVLIGPPLPMFVNLPPPLHRPGVLPAFQRPLPVLVRPTPRPVLPHVVRPPSTGPQTVVGPPGMGAPAVARPPGMVGAPAVARPPGMGAPTVVRTPSGVVAIPGSGRLGPPTAPRRTVVEPPRPPAPPRVVPAARAVQVAPPPSVQKPRPPPAQRKPPPVCRIVNGIKVCR